MKRLLLSRLIDWKNSPYRKPLVLKGVRQVGKTWLLKEFGRLHYKHTAYFNFDENPEYQQFFDTTRHVDRILQNLMIASGQKIVPEDTLLIFDEIQDCPHALNSLKYFCENSPQYHVACAGSLLGIALSKPTSVPVGKVNFLQVEPMTFSEFLIAGGHENLAAYLGELEELAPLPDAFFNPLYEQMKMYFVTGGMPEAVKLWTEAHDVAAMQTALADILNAYERDFAKHPAPKEFPRISLIWKSIPSQLARENKKFLYRVVKEGARAREYEDALQWLIDARLIHKVFRSSAPGIPLSAYDDLSSFKIYLTDVGLLRRMALLSPSAFAEGNRLFTEFKGALAENYILQALLPQFEAAPRYWSQHNPSYEVDFLIQYDNDIIPLEVKAETNVRSRSLKIYTQKFRERTPLRVRFSLDNLKFDDDLLNIPLFMADQTSRLIALATREEKQAGTRLAAAVFALTMACPSPPPGNA
ncbi:MAG: ATP-binding protein [Desulfovibrionaceae bacterium]|nr:ATP-binding protein [Desulfovibrionaceae bacterium]